MTRSLTPFDAAVLAGGSLTFGLGTHPAVLTDPLAYAPLVVFWTVAMWIMSHALAVAPEAIENATARLASRLDGGGDA